MLREVNGMRQIELATASGLAQEAISRIETGRQEPRWSTLTKLAKGFGILVEKIFEDRGN
jgi:DNA-binding XRE family transcriptional regulator